MTQYTQNFGLALPDFRQGPWHDQINSDFTKIDALLFSALSGANVELWTHSTLYRTGVTVVDDSDASIWLCAVEHTSAPSGTFAADRLANPTYWTRLLTGFAPRGEWANATNYFPYDLVYDSHLGIMGLCTLKHTSIAVGNITDDEIYWSFLIDMSNADLSTAVAVTYDATASGLDADNVQEALDVLETQIIALNNVNVTQGTNIAALQTKDSTHETRMSSIEGKNIEQDALLVGLRADIGTRNTSPPAIAVNLQQQINDLRDQVAAFPSTTFPVGTRMLFMNPAPPTGWTQYTAINDRAIRVVSGASGGTAGGAVAFSSVFANTATGGTVLTGGHMPAHDHAGGAVKTTSEATGDYIVVPAIGAETFAYHYFKPMTAQGGNASHNHPLDLRVLYVDVCVGVKA